MWLALLKNHLTKLVAEKTIGAVTHKLKKDQIVREREIENAKIQRRGDESSKRKRCER